MKPLLLILLLFEFSGRSYSQTVKRSSSSLIALEDFLNKYVSDLNDVTHYTLRIKKGLLDKETHLNNGESHHKTFKLKNAQFTLEENEIEEGAREFYDFIVYWDVHINGSWIATEIYNQKDAEKIIDLLKALKEELN